MLSSKFGKFDSLEARNKVMEYEGWLPTRLIFRLYIRHRFNIVWSICG
jgi:hypothetical protein